MSEDEPTYTPNKQRKGMTDVETVFDNKFGELVIEIGLFVEDQTPMALGGKTYQEIRNVILNQYHERITEQFEAGGHGIATLGDYIEELIKEAIHGARIGLQQKLRIQLDRTVDPNITHKNPQFFRMLMALKEASIGINQECEKADEYFRQNSEEERKNRRL